MRKVLLLSHFTDGETKSQRSSLPKAIGLGNGRVRLPTQISLTSSLLLLTTGPHSPSPSGSLSCGVSCCALPTGEPGGHPQPTGLGTAWSEKPLEKSLDCLGLANSLTSRASGGDSGSLRPGTRSQLKELWARKINSLSLCNPSML